VARLSATAAVAATQTVSNHYYKQYTISQLQKSTTLTYIFTW